ncbi:MAG TPA: FAD-binding oxidoreductase [Candidatus Acidoferrales bacterium]|nr:FAD-binding oxidoreductase [Candidatus Acidoferrales bacterium]
MTSSATVASSRLSEIVGAQNVLSDPRELSAYAVGGIIPKIAARPGTAQEVADIVKFAAAENLAVIPTGARTKLGIGMPPTRYDLAIDLTRLDRVISYDPGDLTLSVEPGISLVRLAQILVEHNQFLPLDVPYYERATVGGTLASGVDSPLRQAYGTPRDFVLGMEFVTGEGALAKSGGRVVKNVTGYDLHKLMLGAIGSLGIITRVNFKTFPLPPTTATFIASFSTMQAAAAFNSLIHKSPLRCQSIEMLSPSAVALLGENASPFADAAANSFLVAVRIAGNDAVLARCERDLRTMAESSAGELRGFTRLNASREQHLWTAIREFPAALLAQTNAVLLKAGCLRSDFSAFFEDTSALAQQRSVKIFHMFRGCGIFYCWIESAGPSSNLANVCREFLQRAAISGRSATIISCPLELKRRLNIWGPPREDFPLMQQLKRAFDPRNIFAPGRFVGGL